MFAKTHEPNWVFLRSSLASPTLESVAMSFSLALPSLRDFSSAATALESPTYSGTRRERVNSASLRGLERRELVSPEGMSSSVVVTWSWIT